MTKKERLEARNTLMIHWQENGYEQKRMAIFQSTIPSWLRGQDSNLEPTP